MKVGISVKIDVTKIDKSLLYQGAKGTYLDLTTFVELDEKDQYENNGFIAQSQSKEDRESGAPKPPILGNVRVFYKGESNQQRQDGYQQAVAQQAGAPQQAPGGFINEDIPFAPLMKNLPF